MDFLGNFVYYFIDHGLEIVQIVIVFITFFGMRAELTRKNVFLSLIVLFLFSFLWVLKEQNIFFVIVYILFVIAEVFVLYSEFDLKKLTLKCLWSLIFVNIVDAMVYNSATSIFGYFNLENEIVINIFTYVVVFTFLLIISKFIKEKVKFILKLSMRFYLIYLFVGLADYIILSTVFLIVDEVDKRVLFVCIIVSISILFQYSLVLLMTVVNEGLKFQHYLNEKYMHVQQENYQDKRMSEHFVNKTHLYLKIVL